MSIMPGMGDLKEELSVAKRRIESLSAQVAELKKDGELWRTLQAAVNANPLPDSPEDIEAWAKRLGADVVNAND